MWKPDIEGAEWKVGSRYTYVNREFCIMCANAAKAKGFEVRFGLSKYSGQPYFEIVDPFEQEDAE